MNEDIITKLSLTESAETFGGVFPSSTVIWFYENDIYCIETYIEEALYNRVNCIYFFKNGRSVTLTEEQVNIESKGDIDDTLFKYLDTFLS